ncbi:hypothetical protein CLOP_g12090 [Closterium sp. NIES-67]|nr:hypothetical protein CLOP_g12090 [Closterium sp. NIES-67]
MKGGDYDKDSSEDRYPGQFFFVSTQAAAAAGGVEGFEEPATVGKVTLHSLDFWVIDSGATYSMTPRADLLTELEPSPVKHVTSALGQRAEIPGEPTNPKEAWEGPNGKEWKKASDEEMGSIIENNTFDLVNLPSGRKAISSKWLFKRKTDADGNIERYKSRLVAKGYQQQEKKDYNEEVMLKLQDKFKCKTLGDVNYYLGLHIERDVEKRWMQVHQKKYLEALAANFGKSEGHVATPLPSGFKF